MEKENILINQELSNEEMVNTTDEKKTNKIKNEDKSMDLLEKIREEERAKLEALRQKEQEKTRLAIEKERARLEAELAREIRELEKQLDRAKNASQKVKAQTTPIIDVPNILKEVSTLDNTPVTTIDQPLEVEEKKEDVKKTSKKTTSKKSTSKAKSGSSKTKKSTNTTKKTESKEKKETPKKTKKVASEPAKEEVVTKEVIDEAKDLTLTEEVTKQEEVMVNVENVNTEEQVMLPEVIQEDLEKQEKLLLEEERIRKEQEELARLAEEKAKQEELERMRLEEERIRKEQEELARQEEARLAEEKAKQEELERIRLEEERKEQEELARQEEVRLAEEKAKQEELERIRLEEERKEQERKQAEEKTRRELEELFAKKDSDDKKDTTIIAMDDEKISFEKTMDTYTRRPILLRENVVKKVDMKNKPSNAMNSLQKLKEKIAAQKRLERELMEREAIKVQEKEKLLQEKFISLQKMIEEEENLVTLEELEQERQKVEILRKEIQVLESHIDNLQTIVDKVSDLNIDGIRVIDPVTWELTDEFKNLASDTFVLNKTIAEIEEELDALTKSHEEYINKLVKAEENYKALEQLYNQQEQLISDLNGQLTTLREQIVKEKVLNREYSSQIDRLKNEKIRLERSIKYFRPSEVVSLSEDGSSIHGLLVDLERLNDEVRRLITNDDSKKYKEELAKKDLEIENLRQQLEEIKAKQEKEQEQQQIPFYANPNNLFIPRGFSYPQVIPQMDMLDAYISEVRKLKDEIEKLRQPQMAEPVAKPEVFEDEKITEVKAEPKAFEEKVEFDKASFEELDKKQQRILELEKLIEEKDKYIENIKKQMHEISEEDIFDPDFKRKIRVIRDKKAELEEKAIEEDYLYHENTRKYSEQMQLVQLEIDAIRDKIFDLDLSYRQSRDFSSSAKDEYEKAKMKLTTELQLLEAKAENLNSELVKVSDRLRKFVNYKDEEMRRLNEEEVSIIQYYLNLMIKDNQITVVLKSTEEEKEHLIKELDELKSQDDNIITEIDAYEQDEKRLALENKIIQLEDEIQTQTNQYNNYYEKLSELKAELSKRIELESNLRQNDDDIASYSSTRHALEDYQAQYTELSDRIALLQVEIDNAVNLTREEMLRKKAEITDLIVRREDLKAKIEFYKGKLVDLEKDENIAMYKRLVNQINQIRKISKDHRNALEILKADIANKTKELENLKSELKML